MVRLLSRPMLFALFAFSATVAFGGGQMSAAAQAINREQPVVNRKVELPSSSKEGDKLALSIGLKISEGAPVSRLVVRSLDSGELIGSVAPFATPSADVQKFSILVPIEIERAARRSGGTLNLSLELEQLPSPDSGKKSNISVESIEARTVKGAN